MNIIVRTTLEQAIEDLKMLANPNVETFELNQLLSDDIEIVLKEIERLNKSLEEQRHFYLEKLQQKENIIKEVRKYIENNKDKEIPTWSGGDYDYETCLFAEDIKEILEILDKGE